MEPKIRIQDYTYNLPDERIAKYPLERRDNSQILHYKDGAINTYKFSVLPELLPAPSFMVFNNTRVVPARLFFRKESGAVIEIFCLEPHLPNDYALSFASTQECEWSVVIGNAKKWKGGELFFICDEEHKSALELNLRAELVSKGDNGSVVRFKWSGEASFSEVLNICGRIPIPPYLNRDTESLDLERYQTLYAQIKGSVAAPTAGLHFTDEVLSSIDNKGVIERGSLCLHVGAGTFLPVKSEYIVDHKMHTESFEVTLQFLERLVNLKEEEKVVAVGTTSTRTLESLYFIGVQCLESGKPGAVTQWEPYAKEYNYTLKESISAIIKYLCNNNLDKLIARTAIIIVPSYKFRVVDVLITNFHQPQSTLLLLIAAFIGEEWQAVYKYAMENNFRFLSYGDSSILFRKKF